MQIIKTVFAIFGVQRDISGNRHLDNLDMIKNKVDVAMSLFGEIKYDIRN